MKFCQNYLNHRDIINGRPVVRGCAGCAMAHPDFGRSANPISTRADGLCQPNCYWHTLIFRPSDGPAMVRQARQLLYRNFQINEPYSRVQNKHSPTLISFLTFFQGLRPYSGLHRAYFSSISIRYKWGYAYSF